MREILFRGKRIDNGDWVYGYYARKGTDEEFFRHFICVNTFSSDYRSNYTYPFYLNDYEVDPSSVSEFTGLTDKNGKKVFEGDIISVPGSRKPGLPGIVLFHQLDAKYILFRQRYSYLNLINVNNWGYVIGNVHDNPELLEDKL